jgi:transcriptional regulator with PAS, ATPase and Fis domain
MDIAFIAPYQDIRTKAQSIIETNGYPARTYVGDLQSGVAAARKAISEGARIIISRGGTARLIRESLGIEVIEVGGSIYKVLEYVHANTTWETKVAIVGFRQFISLVQPVCDILGRVHRTFIVSGSQGLDTVTAEVVAWEPDVVIGDAVSVRMAKRHELNFHLIESSMETIVDAFEQAMLVLNNLHKHIVNAEKLSAVLNCTKEGAMLISSRGRIEEINRHGCRLLRDSRKSIIGRSYHEVFQAEELDEARSSRKSVSNILVTRRNTRFAVEHVTIKPKDGVSSSVILFQKVEHIEEAGNAIRQKLMEKGFYAKYVFEDILYRSEVMRDVVEVARQYSRTDCNIMIQGETGTGKELFAQSIHNESPLADGPFVPVNCAALSGSLLESELFGYAPGAFTGALRTGKTGLFELANGGTLFLDEITEMDVFLQSKLLRALQAREIMRIGDHRVIPVNVRVISATNRSPREEVRKGKLRDDLFFRLDVLNLTIPPLRDREGDASFLFRHFLDAARPNRSVLPPEFDLESGNKENRSSTRLHRRLVERLDGYGWPGNVRELQNMAEKYIALQGMPDQPLMRHLLPSLEMPEGGNAAPGPDGLPFRAAGHGRPQPLKEFIADYVSRVLELENGNIARTAARLEVDRNTVKRWLAKAD